MGNPRKQSVSCLTDISSVSYLLAPSCLHTDNVEKGRTKCQHQSQVPKMLTEGSGSLPSWNQPCAILATAWKRRFRNVSLGLLPGHPHMLLLGHWGESILSPYRTASPPPLWLLVIITSLNLNLLWNSNSNDFHLISCLEAWDHFC